jgi:phage terminase small subunit
MSGYIARMAMQFDDPFLYPDIDRPEPETAYVRLKPAEKAFVNAYLSNLGQSAKAAGKALADFLESNGTPADNTERANRMLAQPHIKAAIKERARSMSDKFEVTGDRLLREISAIAFANFADYVHFDEDGLPYYDFRGVTHGQMSAISELTVETYMEGKDDNAREVKRVKMKLHDKQNAQEKLMRFMQMYAPERLEINVNTRSEQLSVNLTPEQLADLYQQRLRG